MRSHLDAKKLPSVGVRKMKMMIMTTMMMMIRRVRTFRRVASKCYHQAIVCNVDRNHSLLVLPAKDVYVLNMRFSPDASLMVIGLGLLSTYMRVSNSTCLKA